MVRPTSTVAAVAKDARTEETRHSRRWTFPYSAIAPTVAALDAIIILMASLVSGLVYHSLVHETQVDVVRVAMTAVVIGAMFIFFFRERGRFEPSDLMNLPLQIRSIAAHWTVTFLVFMGVAFAFKAGAAFSRGSILSFGVAGFALLLGHHALWRRVIKSGLKRGAFRGRKSILISASGESSEAIWITDLAACGFEIEHHIFLQDTKASQEVIQRALHLARDSEIDEIFIAADIARWKEIDVIAEQLSVLPIPITLIPDKGAAQLFRRPPRQLGATFGIECKRPPLTLTERLLKRLLDLTCAILGIVLFMPLFAIIAVMITLDSPGPALFLQTRRGFNGKRFKILKFRTMTTLDDGPTVKQAQRNDSRVTPVGLWLRKTSIDELPQLFNVLVGNMSIVGPRPHAAAHDDYYSDLIGRYAFRHKMKPGITGWAQVKGYRGETPTVDLMKKRVQLDVWYVDNWSILLDVKIILRTLAELVRARNAY